LIATQSFYPDELAESFVTRKVKFR